MRPQQRRPAPSHADIPREIVRRAAADLDDPTMDTSQVMPRADRDAVPLRVLAAAGAEDHVVVVEARPRRADRNGTAPAVALEDRVAVARLALPFLLGVTQEALETAPGQLGRTFEPGDGGAEERHHRRGAREAELRIRRLPVLVRTHLHLGHDEGRAERGRRPAAALERPLDL